MWGYDHPTDPIGPEPGSHSPEQRSSWHAAFIMLGPADGVDVRNEDDGRLLLMRASYEAETSWAPRFVGDEMRLARLGSETSTVTAARADAEAQAAAARGDHELAAAHTTHARSARAAQRIYQAHEDSLTPQMEARREWDQATGQTRRLAIAADAELRRRNPDQDLEPLRSGEPARPSDEERTALIPDGEQDYQPPEWITRLAADRKTFQEKLADRQSVRMPAEDHEWEDLGHAWPEAPGLHRDAILQPPKPEIRPPDRAGEPARQAGAGHEASG
jgi:hypothetical protein